MAHRVQRALQGLVGGAIAASTMSLTRFLARRAGVIERTVPQVVEEGLTAKTGLEPPGGSAGHQLAAEILHQGLGAAMGAGFGALAGRGRTLPLRQGLLLGLGVWLTWMFAIVPLTSLTRPPWRARLREEAVDGLAHLLYGAVTVLVIDELRRQPSLRPRSSAERRRTSVA
jgi:hypothetical protein